MLFISCESTFLSHQWKLEKVFFPTDATQRGREKLCAQRWRFFWCVWCPAKLYSVGIHSTHFKQSFSSNLRTEFLITNKISSHLVSILIWRLVFAVKEAQRYCNRFYLKTKNRGCLECIERIFASNFFL